MNALAPQAAADQSQSPVVISVNNVSKRFGDERTNQSVLALDNVSLDIRKGEFVCLLGPSGCGKSTLLNIIGGLTSASSGSARINGREIKGPTPDLISFVFQESTLLPWYTIVENFNIALKFQGVHQSEWTDRTMKALKSVGMATFANHYPNQLSVGMRQRVNMARGIALKTDVLLMDEPFAALDEQTRMVLGEDLSVLLAETGKTIVFVTHSLAEAVFLSDRIIVMSARPGRIKTVVEVGEPHPRSPDFMLEPRFSELRNDLYALLRDEIRAATAALRDPGSTPVSLHG